MGLSRRAARLISVSAAVAITSAVLIPSAFADSGSATQAFSQPTSASGTGTSTSPGAAPNAVDYCRDSAVITTAGGSEVDGSGRTTCSEAGSVVEYVTLTFWEKVGSGYRDLGDFHPNGAPTPYFSGVKTVSCNKGDNVHVFYATRVLTPDGVYISDPGANTTPVKCQ
jgi:hypothetical protein